MLSAGIRHYPPEAFGGTNFSYEKKLGNIRHSSIKRIDTVIIYDGLRKKIGGFGKNEKFLKKALDVLR